MGYCKIIGGGTDGRYDIELDFGKAQKDAIMAALNAAINKNDLDILQTENDIAEAAAEEAALFLVIQDLIAQYVVITRGQWTGTAEEAFEIMTGLPKKQAELAQMRVKNEQLRYKLRQLKFVRLSLRKQAEQFNLFQPIQRRQAWCADVTENRAAGAYVGTLEVKGEPDLVLIQPGARAWIPTDGIVRGREVMSPWQAYWNAAVLPGWQKWKPTYRWGTLTAIDREANTGSVALAAATSSARRLGVNQSSSLRDVPFRYMTCDHYAFDVGDNVIVAFGGQDWANPEIVGFVDNPKKCEQFALTYRRIESGSPGFIFSTQQVYKGQDAQEVTTIPGFFDPEYGYADTYGTCRVWCGWDDGLVELSRHDKNIRQSKTYGARYYLCSGAFNPGRSSFGFSTRDGGAYTVYRRTFYLSFPAEEYGMTVVSGPAAGDYDSGWTTWEGATMFMAGTTLTATKGIYDKTLEFTFQLYPRDDGTDGSISDSAMLWQLIQAPTSAV